MGYSEFALAFFLGGKGDKLDAVWVILGVGHTQCGFFFPSLMDSLYDKKRQEDTMWVGCTVSLAGLWAQHPGHIMEAPLSGPCWGGSSV